MNVLILGGGGFIGQKLTYQLVKEKTIQANGVPHSIHKITLLDRYWPEHPVQDSMIHHIQGDITDTALVATILKDNYGVIFHLAAIVSGEAEKNFDKGMEINLHANIRLLEVIRSLEYKPVLVFASSCAAFGGESAKGVITDNTSPAPQSSYGTQKVITELLINDYSRRGWVHGRILRLPTIAIRPGKPNAATTSFVSGIIREPLQGVRANCPVSNDIAIWILSPKAVVYNFIHAAGLTNDVIGDTRIINLPGNTYTVQQMVDAMDTVAHHPASDLIDWTPDAFIQSIVLTFPRYFKTDLADRLGFKKDGSIEEIIKDFVENELKR